MCVRFFLKKTHRRCVSLSVCFLPSSSSPVAGAPNRNTRNGKKEGEGAIPTSSVCVSVFVCINADICASISLHKQSERENLLILARLCLCGWRMWDGYDDLVRGFSFLCVAECLCECELKRSLKRRRGRVKKKTNNSRTSFVEFAPRLLPFRSLPALHTCIFFFSASCCLSS